MKRTASAIIVCLLLALTVRSEYEDRFFDSSGVKIRYIIAGSGEPVVLIHGFLANAELNWDPVIKDLSRDHMVIAMDCRGHGKSDKPHDASQYGTQMTADVVRLMDHLKIKRAHIAGYSMGGFITLKLLTEHPDRFLTATLGGSGGIRAGFPFAMLEPLIKKLESGVSVAEAMGSLGLPAPPPEQAEMLKKMSELNDPKALAAAARGWKDLIVTDDQLKAIKVPTFAIYGSKDTVPMITGLKGLIPGIEFAVIDGADHLGAPTRPEFVSGIRGFIEHHRAH
jgi:pimeloyl-ACP methyl ester carboxylesterase